MNKKTPILIVDDDERICNYLSEFLSRKGYRTKAVTHGQAAIDLIKKGSAFSLVILDIMMPGLDGLDTLKQIRQIHSDLPVLMLSALGHANVVVEAMKVGAFDFIVKPFEDEELEVTIHNVFEKQKLIDEVKTLKERLAKTDEGEPFLFLNNKMDEIKEVIDQVAGTDLTVLMQGESGVGKEVIAREIYKRSPRKDKPFVKVNCAAIPV